MFFKIISFLSCVVIAAVTLCQGDLTPTDVKWLTWKRLHGKVYNTNEDIARRTIWEAHLEMITRHNGRRNESFTLEMNRFADQLPSERKRLHTEIFRLGNTESTWYEEQLTFAPSSWDWRTKGVISPVQNQGELGDVASIAVTEEIESYLAMKTGRLVWLSSAEAHDCCDFHTVDVATYQCIHNIGGLCSEASYPKSKGSCQNNSCTPAVQINGGKQVPAGREDLLQMRVYQTPVVAMVDAGHSSFQLYQSGVYDEPDCSETKWDHAVQIVGYGSMDGQDYWICKNSWGEDWGMKGYILMSRNKKNQCGIASKATYAY